VEQTTKKKQVQVPKVIATPPVREVFHITRGRLHEDYIKSIEKQIAQLQAIKKMKSESRSKKRSRITKDLPMKQHQTRQNPRKSNWMNLQKNKNKKFFI